jgi:predicted regulator of Ras-like GTPase activity (Roadblock/LC7/MglB family)
LGDHLEAVGIRYGMLKLRVRSKLMAALAVLLILATPAGAWLALKLLPDKLSEMHILLVFAIQLLVPIFFAATIYQSGSGAQKIRVAGLMITIGMISAGISNLCSPGASMRMLGDQIVLLSLAELATAVAGGIVGTICLYALVPDSVYAESTVAAPSPLAPAAPRESKEEKKEKKEREKAEKALAKEREKADKEAAKLHDKAMGKGGVSDAIRSTGTHKVFEVTPGAGLVEEESKLVKGEMSNSATNLRGLLDTISPEDGAKTGLSPAEISAKADAVAKAAALKSAPADPNAPAERKPTSTSTATRLQAQKRKSTSTFTKLQALSASGTGTQRTKTDGGEEGSESLKSILDRLDETADEPEMDSLFGGGSLLSSGSNIPSLPKDMTASPKPAVPTPPPSQLSPPSQLTKPGLGGSTAAGGTTTSRPTPESVPSRPIESPSSPVAKPDATPAAPAATPVAAPAASTSADAPSLSDMLDSIATPTVMAKEVDKPITSKPGLGATPLGKAATGKKTDIKIGSSTSMDNLPAMSGAIGEEVTEAAPEVIPAPTAEKQPEPADSPGIFGSGGVDKDIDDIFSALVPEEAQKEVRSSGTFPALPKEPAESATSGASTPATPPKPAASALPAKPLAAAPVTAPTASAKPPTAPAPSPTAASPAGSATSAQESPLDRARNDSGRFTPIDQQTAAGALFETGIDKELDDIFSNLVPAEAQKEVNTRTTGTNLPSLESTSIPELSEAVSEEPETEAEAIETKTAEASAPPPKVTVPEPKAATAPAPETVAAEEKKESLFASSLDKEIDDIFSNLAPTEAQKTVSDETLGKVRPPEAATQAEEMSFAPPADGDMSEEKDGKFVDTLGNLPAVEASQVSLSSHAETATPAKSEDMQSFAPPAAETFAPTEQSTAEAVAEAVPTPEHQPSPISAATDNGALPAAAADQAKAAPPEPSAPSPQQRVPAREIKEFGRLSTKVATPDPSEATGTMKTIGKLLIDVTAVENIIKSGETGQIGKNLASTRVISQLRGEGIKAILVRIDSYEGVSGSLIVGHDGLVIASTLPTGMDKDSLGVLSVACVSTSNLGTRKLEIGKLKQMVMITNTSVSVLTDVDVGILAVFMKAVDVARIDGLLDTIHETIHGS